MWFSLNKYKKFSFVWLGLFFLLVFLSLLIGLSEGVDFDFAVRIGLPIGLVCGSPFLVAAIYGWVTYATLKGKAATYTPEEGVISNWGNLFRSVYAYVSLTIEGKEYRSGVYFFRTEAKNLVGKRISYAVIDEKLFIYQILENE